MANISYDLPSTAFSALRSSTSASNTMRGKLFTQDYLAEGITKRRHWRLHFEGARSRSAGRGAGRGAGYFGGAEPARPGERR